MKVFVSWSGPTGKEVARILKDWLQNVIQPLDPWVSEEDIGKGRRWSPEIAKVLSECKAGVIVVTRESMASPWLNFEAGAISKTVSDAHVCPVLFRLKATDLTGPLAQFQATHIEQQDVKRLVVTLNAALRDVNGPALSEPQLNKAFEMWWPQLKAAVDAVPAERGEKQEERSERELLTEVLQIVRDLSRESAGVPVLASANLVPTMGPAAVLTGSPDDYWVADHRLPGNVFFVGGRRLGTTAVFEPPKIPVETTRSGKPPAVPTEGKPNQPEPSTLKARSVGKKGQRGPKKP